MDILLYHFKSFFIVFTRISGIFVATPVFASKEIPKTVKGILGFFAAVIVYPLVFKTLPIIPVKFSGFIFLCSKQAIIGLLIGLIASMLLIVYQVSAQFFSMQMGFGIISVFDPMTESNIPLIGQFQGLLGLLIFIMLRGDIMVLSAVRDSFFIWKDITIQMAEPYNKIFFNIIAELFVLSFQIGSPMIATMFLISVASGLMARAAPQMNILILELPLKIAVGLLSLFFLLPVFFNFGNYIIFRINDYIKLITKLSG